MKRTTVVPIGIALLALLFALVSNASILAGYLEPTWIKPVKAVMSIIIAIVTGLLLYRLVRSVKQSSVDREIGEQGQSSNSKTHRKNL